MSKKRLRIVNRKGRTRGHFAVTTTMHGNTAAEKAAEKALRSSTIDLARAIVAEAERTGTIAPPDIAAVANGDATGRLKGGARQDRFTVDSEH